MAANVNIVTFRDIFQYEAGKKGRYSDEYPPVQRSDNSG